jgi:hypothetical protein
MLELISPDVLARVSGGVEGSGLQATHYLKIGPASVAGTVVGRVAGLANFVVGEGQFVLAPMRQLRRIRLGPSRADTERALKDVLER